MILSLKNFTGLVRDMAAAVQSRATALIDLSIGSALRSILEASASVGLWLQWLIIQTLTMTRAATSLGADLDTWMADFGLTRSPPTASAGPATFSRYSTASVATVPVGAQVKTADGTRLFQVATDTSNSAWNGSNGYTVPISTASVTVPVQDVTTDTTGALSVGTAGNVQPNTITLLASAIPGVDTVTNAVAFTNGVDPETDSAFRTRFAAYIASLPRGTKAAVQFGATVQQGMMVAIAENIDEVGNYRPGHFIITVDDGTGTPSSPLRSQAYGGADLMRPIGSTFSVQPPSVLTANIAVTVVADSSHQHAAIVGPVEQAIEAFIDGLTVAQALTYLRLPGVIYGVAGVAALSGLTVNGGTSDIGGGATQVVRVGSVTVN